MKGLKNKIKEFIFGELLRLLFKYSNTHKLIRFQKIALNGRIDYELIIRTTVSKDNEELEKHLSEYFKNIVLKNAN